MKRKKMMCLLGLCAMLAVAQPVMVSAAELTEAVIQQEQEGDGYEMIESIDTMKSEQTPCFVSVETLCPEGFGLNTYVLLQDDEGRMYRVSIHSENHYVGQIYLAEGHYTVTEISVFDDYKQEYPFVAEEAEFTLGGNENRTISFRLRDYEKIEAEIAGRKGEEKSPAGLGAVVLTDEQFYDTGIPGVTMQGAGTLYYTVEHNGNSEGIMEASGYATGAYDILVKIVKRGVVGEAVFQISLDGGKTYVGQDVVADSCKIGDAGITLYFKTERDTMEFVEGDEYWLTVPETFSVITSKAGPANVIVTGHPVEDHDFSITVLSSGGLGKSRFTISSTKGSVINVTDVLPADGIYELEDGIILVFADSTAYEKGMTYSVTIKSNDDTVNYTPLYIVIGVAVSAVAAVISVLAGKKEKESEYRIRSYKWRKDEQAYER